MVSVERAAGGWLSAAAERDRQEWWREEDADAGVDDPSDPVATEDGWRRFHVPHRYRLGWLPSSQLQVRHRRS